MKVSGPNLTPPAAAALRKVFQLLEDHFDGTEGQYKNEYTDDRIAKETGISKDAVKQYRQNAFGKIKPPTELQLIRMDLAELEKFALTTESEIKSKVKELTNRLNTLQRKFD